MFYVRLVKVKNWYYASRAAIDKLGWKVVILNEWLLQGFWDEVLVLKVNYQMESLGRKKVGRYRIALIILRNKNQHSTLTFPMIENKSWAKRHLFVAFLNKAKNRTLREQFKRRQHFLDVHPSSVNSYFLLYDILTPLSKQPEIKLLPKIARVDPYSHPIPWFVHCILLFHWFGSIWT